MKRGGKSKKEWRKEKGSTSTSKEPAALMSTEDASSLSRKRNLEELLQCTRIDNGSDGSPSLNAISRIRLEAIFHPKFENEAVKDSQIRRDMKERVANGEGFLEVSLKHSGSLMLWSGGQRYYSKNSTDNVFTHTGEILLRQHFVRAFWMEQETGGEETTQSTTFEEEVYYRECSHYVEENRLTLAFEVVTVVLGDHGDRPKRDFLILTAVAGRNRETFYSTQQVVEMAQRFRLPHNDFWVFSSQTSTDALFEFYDNCRETSLAPFVVDTLSESAEIVVPSLYPHVDFQGDILEGIVIRFVSNSAAKVGGGNPASSMEQLSQVAKGLCTKIPPTLPDCCELVERHSKTKGNHPTWLSTNVRRVFYSCRQDSQGNNDDTTRLFAEHVANVLSKQKKRRTAARLSKDEASKVSVLLESLVNSTSDEETKRIARVVQKLRNLNIRVDYSVVKEEISGLGFSRWLCIVHIILDQSHQKYRRNMNPGDMALFRGFALELSTETSFSINARPASASPGLTQDSELVDQNPADMLMLKMKFLPYMIRTFCCRNGLRNLKQSGIGGFVKYSSNLMRRWKISAAAKKKQEPFLRAWAEYAEPRLQDRLPQDGDDMLRLTSNCYLEHLERFIPLFESGEIDLKDASSFRGFVIVVSPIEESANKAADYIANKLSCPKRFLGAHTVPRGISEGVVCSVSADEKSGRFRHMLTDRGDPTFLICFGCSDEDFENQIGDEHIAKALRGKLNAWKKLRVTRSFDLPLCALSGEATMLEVENDPSKHHGTVSDEMRHCIAQLMAAGSIDDSGVGLGLLVFFPQIPGSGKSSLLNESVEQELRSFLSKQKQPRTLQVRVGDKTTGKFWPLVKKERAKDPTGVYVADKNLPAKTWDLIANVCAESSAIGVPVIPKGAMKTTAVEGIRFPDGYVTMKRSQTFPFSLQYLAVCLLRVLSRDSGSHPGKLDMSQNRACMIVIMFFCLYERVAADEFIANLSLKFDGNSAFLAREPIEVPFFRAEEPPELPGALRDTLVEAIQAQGGFNIRRKDVGRIKDDYLDDLESRVRKSLEENRAFLSSLTVDVNESRKSFLEQMKLVIEHADADEAASSSVVDFNDSHKGEEIRYVSVEVPPADVHKVLLEHVSDPNLESLWQSLIGTTSPIVGDWYKDSRFSQSPHVTLAHSRDGTTQEEMKDTFGSVAGQDICLKSTAIVWDENTAALEVSLPIHTNEGRPFPPSTNQFTHITLWVQKGTKAFRSNKLPDLVKEGKANRCVFPTAVLPGKVLFKQ